MGRVWGYARVSTEDQELGLQVSALREAGVPEKHIVREKASGKVDQTGRFMQSCWRSCRTVTAWLSGRSIASAAAPWTHCRPPRRLTSAASASSSRHLASI